MAARLEQGNVQVTAIHKHLQDESPRLWWLHYAAPTCTRPSPSLLKRSRALARHHPRPRPASRPRPDPHTPVTATADMHRPTGTVQPTGLRSPPTGLTSTGCSDGRLTRIPAEQPSDHWESTHRDTGPDGGGTPAGSRPSRPLAAPDLGPGPVPVLSRIPTGLRPTTGQECWSTFSAAKPALTAARSAQTPSPAPGRPQRWSRTAPAPWAR